MFLTSSRGGSSETAREAVAEAVGEAGEGVAAQVQSQVVLGARLPQQGRETASDSSVTT